MELFFIIILLVASVVGMAFIVERGLALRASKVAPNEIQGAIDAYQSEKDLPMLQNICERHPSPLARLILTVIKHRTWSKAETVDALQTRARHEIVKLERGLVVLEIVVGIAPLLGLVGTIYGLIMLFGTMGNSAAAAENNQMAKGIATALNATLLGLLTAIPSLIAWSYYNKRVENLAVEMETVCDQFLQRIYHGNR